MRLISQRVPKPTAREEHIAYELATLRDRDTCQRCRRNCGPIARDHRKNRSQGGRTAASNLQCLGLGCHDWKTRHPKAAIAEGWAVPGSQDPLIWPARRYVSAGIAQVTAIWVLYDDQGGWKRISDSEAALRMQGAGN